MQALLCAHAVVDACTSSATRLGGLMSISTGCNLCAARAEPLRTWVISPHHNMMMVTPQQLRQGHHTTATRSWWRLV